MKQHNRTWSLPPCPPYDVEGTESWLSDMAANGWMLEKDSFFFGIASFEKKEPASVRYRLEAAPKQASNWDENSGNPDPEAVEINAEYGWEYVARRGQFFIYRNADARNLETNTDPQVQALAISTLQKRQISSLCTTIFWWIIYPLLLFWKGASFILAAAEAGLFVVLLSVIIPLWMVISGIVEIVHLQKLKKKLQAGNPLDHQKKLEKGKIVFYGKGLLKALLIVLWILMILHMWNDDVMDSNKQELSAYQGELPFATICDFAEGTYEETWNDLRFDYVTQWNNAVLNNGIKWSEHADVHRADGSVLQGGLYITYYDAKTEWLAKAIASEYHRFDRLRAKKNYEPLDCPDFGMDDAVAYSNEMHFPCIIFRQGNVVIHAYFYQTGPDEHMPLEEWAGIIADSIK